MSSNCAKCGETLSPGTEVLQVAQGHYYHGFITPTYLSSSSVLLEGHRDCLADFPVEPQYGVYDCLVCRSKIKDGADVVYAVFGLKPKSPYKRPERRGYKIPFVAHWSCWDLDSVNASRSRDH